MLDVVLTLLALAAGLLALRWVRRVEPHWASRDGRRLIARAQPLDTHDTSARWREVRVAVTADGHVITRSRGLASPPVTGEWRLVEATVDDRAHKALYIARRTASSEQMVLRLPLDSRARPVLDALVSAPPPSV